MDSWGGFASSAAAFRRLPASSSIASRSTVPEDPGIRKSFPFSPFRSEKSARSFGIGALLYDIGGWPRCTS